MPESIRACTAADATAICDIYNRYVRETVITFEETPVATAEMAQRIGDVTAHLPWLVAEEQGAILGYAYATPWKARSAYRFSVETTVYVAPGHMRRGLGAALYRQLIDELRQRGVHAAVGGIALPNRGEHRAAREARLQEDRPIRRDRPQARSLGRRRLLGADPALAGGCFRAASTGRL